jgi:riboflavin kinase/FMN adenylyltransferase
MKIIRHLSSANDAHQFTRSGGVLTIGNFDGLHVGHQAIVQQVLQYAQQHQLRSQVMLFEPQPREFFAPNDCPARLMSRRAKLDALCAYPLDEVICLSFDAKLSRLSASDFVEQLLVKGCQIQHLIVGDDFHFGQDRRGDFALLQTLGQQHGFSVANTASVCSQGKRVSSTWIRQALWQGDFDLAEQLLGRAYSISGKVVYGAQLGRRLGFPTANINLPGRRLPLQGVYMVQAQVNRQGDWLPAVASIGYRPSVDNDNEVAKLEVYLLAADNPHLYGRWLQVKFIKQIRGEEKFADVPTLIAAMQRDVEEAKLFFKTVGADPRVCPQ